jgi:hypothetical protein
MYGVNKQKATSKWRNKFVAGDLYSEYDSNSEVDMPL